MPKARPKARRAPRNVAADAPVPAMRSSDQRIQPWLIAIGLMALVAAVFGQTLNFDFVNFDDGVYVYGSSAVKSGLTWHSMVWAFTHFHAMFWQPLTTLSLMLDYQWHGLRAGGFHLGNVLLHAATVVALFLFLRDVTRQPWASAAAAAIFAVHPLRAESVAWVTERKDVLSGLFFVLTLWAYARYARRPWSLGRYLPIPLLFALGLMSKSMLITLPVILVLLDYWPLRRFPPGGEGWRRLIFEKVPLVVIAIAFSVVTLVAQAQARPVVPIPLSFRLANAVISVVVYLRQLFCPINLAVFYPLPTAGYSALSVILAILLVAGVAAAAIYWAKKYPWFVVGWCWYLVMLVPIIGIVQVGGQAHADRFTYLPQIGLVIAIVWAVAELTKTLPQRRTWLTIAALVVIGVLAAAGHRQTGYWKDSGVLWRHTLACTGPNAVAENNLANFLLTQGQYDDAIAHSEKASAIDPHFEEAQLTLGLALSSEGKFADAVVHYREAIRLKPDFMDAYNNLGMALLRTGRLGDAIAAFERALDLHPAEPADEATMNSNLGDALMMEGDMSAAVVHLKRAVELEPDALGPVDNLAWLLATSPDPAIRDGARAVALAEHAMNLSGATDPKIMNILSAAYAEAGRFPEAISAANAALRLASEQNNAALTNLIQSEITLYEAHQPFRSPAPVR